MDVATHTTSNTPPHMPGICISQDITVTGEVVETLQRDDDYLVKIALRRMHLDVPMQSLNPTHLGDRLILRLTVTIHEIQPTTGLDDTGP